MKDRGRHTLARPIWLAVFLVLTLALCFPGPASASGVESTAVSISTPSQPIGSGEQFTVSIVVVPNTAIAGMQFDLNFDPSLVTVDSVKEGDLLEQGGASTFFNSGKIDNEAGTVTGVFGATTGPGEAVSTEGTFATITLTARTQTGSCPLNLSSVVVGDMNGNPVPVSLDNEGCAAIVAQVPVFRWWVFSVMIGVATTLILITVAIILFQRRQMIKALERAG